MNLYSQYLFPRIMDWLMSGDEFTRLRRDLLKDAGGDVLEIGYGTGLNLAHYPADVSHAPRLVDEMYQGHAGPAEPR
jgi:hypothetical protein